MLCPFLPFSNQSLTTRGLAGHGPSFLSSLWPMGCEQKSWGNFQVMTLKRKLSPLLPCHPKEKQRPGLVEASVFGVFLYSGLASCLRRPKLKGTHFELLHSLRTSTLPTPSLPQHSIMEDHFSSHDTCPHVALACFKAFSTPSQERNLQLCWMRGSKKLVLPVSHKYRH